MTTTDARVEALVNSLVGGDFLVTLVESELSPEYLADPKASLWLAGSSANAVEIWRADHDLITAELPALAKDKASQARAAPWSIRAPHGGSMT